MKKENNIIEHVSLNDFVFANGESFRMLNISVRVDGHFVGNYKADGLIISTPTGSTAYSLSCGGPIMNPNSDTFLLVPIAPHTLTNRPMVVSSASIIKLEFMEENDDTIEISLDGEIISEISSGDCIMISQSENTVEFIHPKQYDYYETLRSKLFWGHDQRNA